MELSHERIHARDCEDCEERDDAMVEVIRRYIVLKGDLSDEQEDRLLAIAKRCPVHRTLTEGPKILDESDLVRSPEPPRA